MSSQPSLGRDLHRVRTRGAAVPPVQWDILQALLGVAYTVQQEEQSRSCEQPRESELDAHAALMAALQRIALSAQNLTEAAGAAIALGSRDVMVWVSRSGNLTPVIGAEIDVRSGLAADCVRSGQPAISLHAEVDSRVSPAASRHLGARSILYLPLRAEKRVIGILGVFASRAWHFSERDLNCLKFTEALVVEALQHAGERQDGVLHSLLKHALASKLLPTPVARAESMEAAAEVDQPSAVGAGGEQPAVATAGSEIRAVVGQTAANASSEQSVETAPASIPAANQEQPAAVQTACEEAPGGFPGAAADEIAPLVLAGYGQASLAASRPRRGRMLLLVIALVLLIVAAVGLLAWRTGRLRLPPLAPKAVPQPQAALAPVQSPAAPAADLATSAPASLRPAQWITPRISFSSEPGRAVITVALPKTVPYEAHRLATPDRVYFDVSDATLSAKDGVAFPAEDGPVSRVRIARFGPGVSRIVFDLRVRARYKSALAGDPERLVIELYEPEGKPVNAPSQAVKAPAADPPPPVPVTVVIDPGHGGHDQGTIGRNGLLEKDVTLDVAARLGRWLQKRLGAQVIYTRLNDEFVPLEERAALANAAQAKFFISIHANASSYRSASGVETFYFSSSADALESAAGSDTRPAVETKAARRFAANVQRALLAGLSDSKRPVRDRGIKPAQFVVLRDAEMPAVLAEISFVTSADDARRLESPAFRERIAKALYRGIANNLRRQPSRSKITSLGTTSSGSQP